MSTVSTMSLGKSSLVSNTLSESKFHKMRQVIAAIQTYLKNKTEDVALIINRHLQSLSFTIDSNIFDPNTNVASEFYVSLYQLMNKMEQGSVFSWNCVGVLSNACKNTAARQALIHTYQFIPNLSRFLGEHLTLERRIQLLRLMQDLTCGIKISWQIPHLAHLMTILARWVESQNEEIVLLSLGTLSNLCYKNLPAIYALMGNVDVKKLARICTSLESPTAKLCSMKLLVIFDPSSDDIPKDFLANLVPTMLEAIIEAFQRRDSISLQQTVEFYADISQQHSCSFSEEYHEKLLRKLLSLMDNNVAMDTGDVTYDTKYPECIAAIFHFFDLLIELKLPPIIRMFPMLISTALNWIQTEPVSFQALSLLTSISSNVQQADILQPLVVGLRTFLLIVNFPDEESQNFTQHKRKVSAALRLLKAIAQIEAIRGKIVEQLKVEAVQKIFAPVLGSDEGIQNENSQNGDMDACSEEAIRLYINALSLINELAKYEANWRALQAKLVQQKEIHMVLAQGMVGGSEDLKTEVFEIVARMPVFPARDVAKAMSVIQPSAARDVSKRQVQATDALDFPVLSIAQIGQVNEVLSRLRAATDNNMSNMSVRDVLDLYEFKLASMGHAERAAVASAEAMFERCTQLQHRNAQISVDLNKSHQVLAHVQQRYEQMQKLHTQLSDTNKRCMSQLAQFKTELGDTNKKLAETSQQLSEVTAAKRELEDQHDKLKEFFNKLEVQSKRLEKVVQKKEEQNKTLAKNNETFSTHMKELLNQKETEMQELQKELQDVRRDAEARKQLLQTITQVASSTQF